MLLIDELDRTDEAFEAFLLEVLSDFQVTVPELGTIKAAEPPIVIITSNRTREIHDALKRRCLYHWVDYPDAARELQIMRAQGARRPRGGCRARWCASSSGCASMRAVQGAGRCRDAGLGGGADRARHAVALDPQTVYDTLGVLLKYQDDIARLEGSPARRLIEQVRSDLAQAPPA